MSEENASQITSRCRTATQADSASIARVHDTSRRHAYRDILTAAQLDKLTLDERAEFWRNKIINTEDSRVFVIEDDDAIVGFVCVIGDRHRNVGEVDRIYVLPAKFGRGFGRGLMQCAKDYFRDFGFEKLQLWAFDANKPAHAFYTKMGLKLDGAERKLPQIAKEVRFAIAIEPW